MKKLCLLLMFLVGCNDVRNQDFEITSIKIYSVTEHTNQIVIYCNREDDSKTGLIVDKEFFPRVGEFWKVQMYPNTYGHYYRNGRLLKKVQNWSEQ